jgi:hypothetical protein
MVHTAQIEMKHGIEDTGIIFLFLRKRFFLKTLGWMDERMDGKCTHSATCAVLVL